MDRDSISPIILAAGDSSRMGFPKALLPLRESNFILHICAKLERLRLPSPTIVLGRHATVIKPQLARTQAFIVTNPDPGRGQLSSLRLALEKLQPSADACLVWPVDQPAVSEPLVEGLLQLFLASGAPLALPCCREKRGHPAIFHRCLFEEIVNTPVAEGMKSLVLRHLSDAALFSTEETAAIADVDTPEDYFRLTGEKLESALARIGDRPK